MVVGAAVALTPVNLIRLLIGTQVLQGIITPVVLSFILILANRRAVLGDAVNGPIFRKVSLVAVGGVAALSLVLLGQTVVGWLGLA